MSNQKPTFKSELAYPTKPDLLALVENEKVKHLVSDLYSSLREKKGIGTGSMADAVRYEIETGKRLSKSKTGFSPEATRRLGQIRKIIGNVEISNSEREIVQYIRNDLLHALGVENKDETTMKAQKAAAPKVKKNQIEFSEISKESLLGAIKTLSENPALFEYIHPPFEDEEIDTEREVVFKCIHTPEVKQLVEKFFSQSDVGSRTIIREMFYLKKTGKNPQHLAQCNQLFENLDKILDKVEKFEKRNKTEVMSDIEYRVIKSFIFQKKELENYTQKQLAEESILFDPNFYEVYFEERWLLDIFKPQTDTALIKNYFESLRFYNEKISLLKSDYLEEDKEVLDYNEHDLEAFKDYLETRRSNLPTLTRMKVTKDWFDDSDEYFEDFREEAFKHIGTCVNVNKLKEGIEKAIDLNLLTDLRFDVRGIEDYLFNLHEDIDIALKNENKKIRMTFGYRAILKCATTLLALAGYQTNMITDHHEVLILFLSRYSENYNEPFDSWDLKNIGMMLKSARHNDLYRVNYIHETSLSSFLGQNLDQFLKDLFSDVIQSIPLEHVKFRRRRTDGEIGKLMDERENNKDDDLDNFIVLPEEEFYDDDTF